MTNSSDGYSVTDQLAKRIKNRTPASENSEPSEDPYIATRVAELNAIMKPFSAKHCLETHVQRSKGTYIVSFRDKETLTCAAISFEFEGPNGSRKHASWDACIPLFSPRRNEDTTVKEIGNTGWVYVADETPFDDLHMEDREPMTECCDTSSLEDVKETIARWLRNSHVVGYDDDKIVGSKRTLNENLLEAYDELKKVVGRGGQIALLREDSTEAFVFNDAYGRVFKLKMLAEEMILEVDNKEVCRHEAKYSGLAFGLSSEIESLMSQLPNAQPAEQTSELSM